MEGDTWSDYRPSFDKANNDNVRAVKTGSLVVIQFHEWSRKGYGLFMGGCIVIPVSFIACCFLAVAPLSVSMPTLAFCVVGLLAFCVMVRTLFDLANAELRHETRLFGYSFWMRKFAFSPQATIGLQLTKYESPNHLKLKLIDGKRMIDVIEFYSTADPKRAGRFAREIASKIDLEFAE